MLASDAGWSRLDEHLTSPKFRSLRKIVLCLNILVYHGRVQKDDILETERDLTLPYINNLFPSFRASNTQRTLESHLKVQCISLP